MKKHTLAHQSIVVSKLTVAGALAALASALTTMMAGPVGAQSIDLSNVAAGTGGFAINGQAADDLAGWSVAGAGDVNGDGLADVIVGAAESDPATGTGAGRSYVVFGKAGQAAVELSAVASGTSTLGFVINGQAAGDLSGRGVSSAGDVNGDGLADLIVGAFFADGPSLSAAGRSYVVFGKTDGAAVELSAVASGTSSLGFAINGQAADDQSGISVAAAGDVNGDGLADVIVGAPYSNVPGVGGANAGRAYVVFGKTSGTAVDLSAVATGTSPLGFMLNGQSAFDYCGRSVASAGDVNGDGLADVIVGSRYANSPSQVDAGRSYVVFGKTSTAVVNLSAVASGTSSLGFVVNGPVAGELSGLSVCAAGDVNGDGLGDVIIGAQLADPAAGVDAGRSYVVFGKTSAAPVNLSAVISGASTLGFTINGGTANDQAGVAVSSAGDVNGDGLADVIVGAYLADPPAGLNAGRAYVVFGKTSGTSIDLAVVETGTSGLGMVINAQALLDYAGVSVSSAGDVNGDGLSDVIVGALFADPPSGANAGRSYVVFSPVVPAASGTYRARVGAGDADRTGIGTSRFGDDEVIFPDSRAWVDFNAGNGPGGPGSSSQVVATLTRTDAGLSSTPVALDGVANVAWEITTNRTGWTNARLTFQYTNAELAAPPSSAIDETTLRIYRAPSPSGPWTMLTGQSVDLARNQISADTNTFSHFLLAGTSILAVDLTSFSAAAESPSSPVSITWTTAAEFDTAGFQVESAPSSDGPWSRVTTTLVPAEGSASSGATYSVVDESPIGAGNERWYRLAETVLDGTTITYEPAKATVGEAASSVGAWTMY